MTTIKAFFEKYMMLVIGLLVGVAIGFCAGWLWRYSSARTDAKLEQEKQYKADTQKVISAADKLEVKKDERQIIYKAITKEVDRLVPDRSVCFDVDRLRIANNAIEAANSGKPDKPMPKANATR